MSNGKAKEAAIDKLVSKKFALVTRIKDIQAELAKVNEELARSGAPRDVVICW